MWSQQGRFREELRLSESKPTGDVVVALALEAGFHRAGIVDPGLLGPWAERMRELRQRGILDRESLRGMEWDWILAPHRWSPSSSILVCCLSCCRHEPDDLSSADDPHALIAPFARANYYRAAAGLLRALALRLEQGLGIRRKSLRLFTNSRIPEKPLLAASGLGTYGRNGLAIVPGLGSLFVIAGMVIPLPSDRLRDHLQSPAPDPCGTCTRCMRACPTGAIVQPGVVDPARCLQGMAGSAVELEPAIMETWGARLYGCQDCQAACPHNAPRRSRGFPAPRRSRGFLGLTEEAPKAPGDLGPSISLRRFLSLDPDALKVCIRGTAIGMSWVSGDALLRNALIAAGNKRNPAVRREVESHLGKGGAPLLRTTARWALERISRG